MTVLLLIVLLYALLHLTIVQNWLVKTVAANLSQKLHATISLNHIDYQFFDKMDIEGLLVEDLHKDTLLYAGSATINISDWFFLKDKATLNYVSLEDAQVNLNRTDTVWNYQFLVDYFSRPKKNDSKGGIEFSLKVLKLHNIRFNKIDQWIGTNMQLSLKDLNLETDKIDYTKKQLHFNKIEIDAPQFALTDFTGNKEKSNFQLPVVKKDSTKTSIKEDSWEIFANGISIKNGVFENINGDSNYQSIAGEFNENHIHLTNINADFKHLHLKNDSLSSNIKLSTTERCGLTIKKLESFMIFTPEIMEFNKLDLELNKTRLGHYYAMHFKDFNNDMGRFLHKINIDANFTNSFVSSDDIAFFAPELKTWKRVFDISGIAKGTVDNFTIKKIKIKTGNSLLEGNIALRGLPNIDNTFIDINAKDLTTNYNDLVTIIPSLKNIDQPNLRKLENIKYTGNYTGFLNDFVAYGTIHTNLGIVTGDINLKLQKNKEPVYLGKISTQNFKLGEFFENNQVGKITFNGKVNGSGFAIDKLDANFVGDLRSIEYSGYNYQNIIVNGDFKKKFFKGYANIDDPNLKVEDLVGTIDLSGQQPKFNFDAKLTKADFKKLNISKDEFDLKGHFNLDFSGNDIDNFLGTAKIYDASLNHNGKPLSFDSLQLQSLIIDQQKYLTLHTNEVDASIAGNFKILELPDAFKVFLSKYYPAYINKPGYKLSEQNFTFQIQTKEADPYIQLLDKKLKGFNNSNINGNLNLKTNELNVNADVEEFSYDKIVFNNVRLKSKGNADTLSTKIEVDDVALSDSLHLPFSNLEFKSYNDISIINLKTSASKTINEASLNASVHTLRDGVNIHFFPSSFIINDKKWDLEKDGEISVLKSLISAKDVSLVQGNQHLLISTEPSATGNYNDVLLQLSNVNIDDFIGLAIKEPKLEGQITGTIKIEYPFGKPFIELDSKIQQFRIDNDSIGALNATGTIDLAAGKILFKAQSDNKDNQLNIEGAINLKDSTSNQIRVALKSEKFDISILNNYLSDIFSEIKGSANTTNLTLSGNGNHLLLTGIANINEGSLKVNYTQCKYKFKNESIVFNPDEIDFGKIELKDTLNNTATLSGKMYHRFFNNVEFENIRFETDRLLVLNTTKKDNNQFYGKVIGRANLLLTGQAENIRMDIVGEPSEKDSSHIYILSGNSIENETVDYIDFVQFGNKMEETFRSKTTGSILLNMELTANKYCKIDVILDETTGDIIKGEGDGLLKIRVGNKEPLTINGQYNISKGEYTFNFQTFLKKYFTVKSGTLVWDGDPFKAKIDIQAEYLATKVDFSNLSSASSNYRLRSDLKVIAHLTETLQKPAIDFELQLPAGSPITDFLVLKRLEQFKEDKNDLNKQVTSLLLFNSFISSNQGFITAGSGYNVISNTIGGVVSNAISGYFNKFLQKFIKNLSFSLDVNSSIGSGLGTELQSNVANLQAAAKSNFIYTVLNGKLIISAGLNLDYNNPYANINRNSNVLVTPDITAEWILSKDGRVRVVGFNRTNFDLIGQRNRTGISLAYRKEVDELSQIFKRSPKKKDPEPTIK